MLKSTKARILALAAVVAVAAVGVAAYFYLFNDDPERLAIQQIETPAASASGTAATTGSGGTPTAAASGGSSSTSSGAFKVDTSKSRARLFAKEDFVGPGAHTAQIDSQAVTGEFTLSASGLDTTKPASFTVDVTQFKSSDTPPVGAPVSRRDGVVQRTLDATNFPKATFTVTKVTDFPQQIPASGDGAAFKMTGMLEVKGIKKEVTMDARIIRSGNTVSALATVTIQFADFGMTPPSVGGFVSVGQDVTIDIQLVATSS